MPERANRRQALEEARLRHQLELQSQQIERVFDHHRLTARVAGGEVQPRAVSFDLQTLATGWERLRGLRQDLMMALGTSSVQISREDGQWRLQVMRPETPPVGLLDLLSLLDEVRPLTAVLGLAEDGQPVLLDFAEPSVTHLLLAGGEQSGKTMLLRSLALSLALHNKQSQLQLVVIDTESGQTRDGAEGQTAVRLDPLNYLPHLLHDVVQQPDEAVSTLNFLADELAYRQMQQVRWPVIVVLVDNVVALLRQGGQPVAQALLRLAQRGAAVGMHLVLATRRPEARELDELRKVSLPLRLVGRVHDAQEAVVATGLSGTQAESLLGKGDFLAAGLHTELVHFQAAYVGDYDLHLSLQMLQTAQPRLLAQPYVQRVSLSALEPTPLDLPFEVEEEPVLLADAVEAAVSEDDLLPLPPSVPENGRLRRPWKDQGAELK